MTEIRFSRAHEWVSLDGETATVGITQHAQEALGDVVFVELPNVGRTVGIDEACAVVESVKAASDVYAPVAGKVVAANDAIVADPALVNGAAEGDGWFFRVAITDRGAFNGLMTREDYDRFVAEEQG
jgi:glycine cleavage system H protein